MSREVLAEPRGEGSSGGLRPRGEEEGNAVGEEEGEAAVALAEGTHARPEHLARRAQGVEVLGPVARDPRLEHVPLDDGGGQGGPLELLDHVEERVGAPPRDRGGVVSAGRHPLPVDDEPRERFRLGGLDLLAQSRERAATEGGKDIGRAPLPRRAAGPELALEDPPPGRQLPESSADRRLAGPEPACHLGRGEGSVRARVAGDDLPEGVGRGLEERRRQSRREGDAEGVAQAPRVLGRRVALLAGDGHGDRAPLASEDLEPRAGGGAGVASGTGVHPGRDLVDREVAETQEEVVEPLPRGSAPGAVEALERDLGLGQGAPVQELAELGLSEQLPQLGLVHGEGLGPPLREGSVALVEVVRGVAEEERRREG